MFNVLVGFRLRTGTRSWGGGGLAGDRRLFHVGRGVDLAEDRHRPWGGGGGGGRHRPWFSKSLIIHAEATVQHIRNTHAVSKNGNENITMEYGTL